MRISIIIPTFRPQEYLWQCLLSIENQTMDHNMFEVLLILNGDRIPYEHEILSFLSKHPSLPCRLIYNEEKGVSAARNRGLDEAKGKYICFIDDDDLISEAYLERLYELISEDTTPLSYATMFDDGTSTYRPYHVTTNYRECTDRIPYIQARRYFYVPYCKMIDREIIGTRRFDKTLQNGEDALFIFLISDRFKWVRFTDKSAAYRYRQRPTSLFNVPQPASYYISNMLSCQLKATRIYLSHPLRYSFIFYFKYMLAVAMSCLRHLRNAKI